MTHRITNENIRSVLLDFVAPQDRRDTIIINRLQEKVQSPIDEHILYVELLFFRVFVVDYVGYIIWGPTPHKEPMMNAFYSDLQEFFDEHWENYSKIMDERLDVYGQGIRESGDTDFSINVATALAFSVDQHENPEFIAECIYIFGSYIKEMSEIAVDYLIYQKEMTEEAEVAVSSVKELSLRKLEVRMTLEIHFHEQEMASIFIETTANGHEQKMGEVLLFAAHTLRIMANLSSHAKSLAEVLNTIPEHLELFAIGDIPNAPKLILYPGTVGRRRFIGTLQKSDSQYIYKEHGKGFGFLGSSVGYYAPQSVLALLRYLAQKRTEEPDYIEWLKTVCRLCADAFVSGKVKVSTQNKIALQITAAALGE